MVLWTEKFENKLEIILKSCQSYLFSLISTAVMGWMGKTE